MATRLVTLASFPSPIEAALARGILAEAGIAAEVAEDSSASLWGGILGGAKLLVEADAERADQILDEALNQPLTDAEEPALADEPRTESDFAENLPDRSPAPGEPAWTCARCGASVGMDESRCWSCGASPAGVINPYSIGFDASIDNGSSQPQAPPTPPAEHVGDWINRAFRAACFSPIILPPLLNFYSAWLLLCAAAESGDLPPEYNRKFYTAWTINLVVGGGATLMWVLFLQDVWPFAPGELTEL